MIRRSTYCQRLMNPHPGISPAPILGYCSASPAVERQPVPTKALSNRGSVSSPPAPFRRAPDLSWPRPTNSVRRNLERPLQHCRMNPLTGIWATHRNTLGYRHLSPYGDSLQFRISATHPVHPQPIMHYESCIMHCYTFSAKERDPETGLSYFGSRYYSSDLSIWLSVDPQAAKYPSLSPYVYCADNPVKLVDPDGEEIIIEWGGMKFYYSGGKLYSDREFKNEYVAEEGSFFHKAQTTLNTIANTKTGKTLVNGLANDTEFKVKIIEGEDSGFELLTKSRDPHNEANAKITWNTSGGLVPVEGGMLRNGVTSLVHELCHGYDYMKNTYSIENGPGCYGDIKICDWKAVFHENQIRQELGLPLRTHYNKNKAQTKGTGSSVLHGKTPFLPPGISPLF